MAKTTRPESGGWFIEDITGVCEVILPTCPVCKRQCPPKRMTKHHLKTRKGDKHDTELMCRECHSYIHRLFHNRELSDPKSPLNTVEGLLAHPEYAKAVAWIKTQDPTKHPKIHTSNRKNRKGRKKRR
jgi:hypothetical protein